MILQRCRSDLFPLEPLIETVSPFNSSPCLGWAGGSDPAVPGRLFTSSHSFQPYYPVSPWLAPLECGGLTRWSFPEYKVVLVM